MKMPLNFEGYKEMVRNRPIPDTPGYYRLSVMVYDPEDFHPENRTHTVRADGHTPLVFEKREVVGIDIVGHAYMTRIDSEPIVADFATMEIVVIPRCYGNNGSQLVLGVVAETPMSLERGYDIFQSKMIQWVKSGHSPEIWADTPDYPGSDDDEYFIQTGRCVPHMENFHYIHPTDVYPAPKDFPGNTVNELRNWYKDYTEFKWQV